jgi:hypothetical protein
MRRAHGLSLVELLVGLVLFSLIGSFVVRASLGMGRALRLLQARAAAQEAVDRGSGWIAAELEEVGPDDVRQLEGDAVRYRALRFAGLACQVSASSVSLILQRGATGRPLQPGRDSLLLLVDTVWRAFAVEGVTTGQCGPSSALVISTTIDTASIDNLRNLRNLWTPVRFFEGMQARFYLSGSSWWLGGRSESAGEGLQPLAGPFLGGGAVWAQAGTAITVRLTDSSRTDSAALFLSRRSEP